MPIKGLTDAYRMPRLGKIHLGVQVPNRDPKKQPYPKATDFFVLPHEDTMVAAKALLEGSDEDVKKVLTPLGRQIAEVYGARPRELDVVLTDNDIHKVFPHNYKYYRKGTGLFCSGDGETAHRLRMGPDGKPTGEGMDEIACLGEECPEYGPRGCRRMANLMVLLPRISYGGAFQIDTSSYNSMIDILSGIKDLLHPDHKLTHGRVAWVPLKLRVGARKCSPGGQVKTVFTMTLTLAEHAEIIALGVKMKEITAALGGSVANPPLVMLPAPQQDKFEETHLIPAEVQVPGDPDPRQVVRDPVSGDLVDQETGEIVESGATTMAEDPREFQDVPAVNPGSPGVRMAPAVPKTMKQYGGKFTCKAQDIEDGAEEVRQSMGKASGTVPAPQTRAKPAGKKSGLSF